MKSKWFLLIAFASFVAGNAEMLWKLDTTNWKSVTIYVCAMIVSVANTKAAFNADPTK
jgi:hypothetical protein